MTTATTLVYVGTYTDTPVRPRDADTARGLVVYELDAAAGTLSLVHTHEGVPNPSYLALDPQQRYLYCVAEVDAGQVHALRIDPTGACLLVAQQHSDALVTFHLDEPSGRLQATGQVAAVASPVCIACSGGHRRGARG
jgi:6-phosphogluconolactonase (cycloisomerase 2 family)